MFQFSDCSHLPSIIVPFLVTIYAFPFLSPYAPWQSTQVCCAVFEHGTREEVPIIFAWLDELEPSVAAGATFLVLRGAHNDARFTERSSVGESDMISAQIDCI